MSGGYDDRDGKICDGTLVDWRSAQVHILTHAMHYASSVFEGSAPMVKFSRAGIFRTPHSIWSTD